MRIGAATLGTGALTVSTQQQKDQSKAQVQEHMCTSLLDMLMTFEDDRITLTRGQ
jgi:hypothetical protein